MSARTIPNGFWPQIDDQLARISTAPVDTFDAVREILLDPRYDQIVTENDRNAKRVFDADSAFFAGSGGDAQLKSALTRGQWRIVRFSSSYYYVMRSILGETLTYCEGDVLRGDHMLPPLSPNTTSDPVGFHRLWIKSASASDQGAATAPEGAAEQLETYTAAAAARLPLTEYDELRRDQWEPWSTAHRWTHGVASSADRLKSALDRPDTASKPQVVEAAANDLLRMLGHR